MTHDEDSNPRPAVLPELFQLTLDMCNEQMHHCNRHRAAGNMEMAQLHMAGAMALNVWMNRASELLRAYSGEDGPDLVEYVQEMSLLDPSGEWIKPRG